MIAPLTTDDIASIFILLVGAAIGFIVQYASAWDRWDGEWESVPQGKKIAMGAIGAISALAAGAWIVDRSEEPVSVYGVIVVQIFAAWGGSIVLDAGVKILERVLGDDDRGDD